MTRTRCNSVHCSCSLHRSRGDTCTCTSCFIMSSKQHPFFTVPNGPAPRKWNKEEGGQVSKPSRARALANTLSSSHPSHSFPPQNISLLLSSHPCTHQLLFVTFFFPRFFIQDDTSKWTLGKLWLLDFRCFHAGVFHPFFCSQFSSFNSGLAFQTSCPALV